VIDACDNCPDTPNPDQLDANRNGIGDACDDAVAPMLLSAVSRKAHGGTEFDIPLPLDPPSTAGVECRSGGPPGDSDLQQADDGP